MSSSSRLTIKITQIDSDKDKFITKAHWKASVFGATKVIKSAFSFEKKSQKIIPIEDVTESTVIKWVKDRIGEAGLSSLKNEILSENKLVSSKFSK
jgi:hypothetical protein